MKIANKHLALPALALIGTSYVEYQWFLGHPVALVTALLWVLAVQAITVLALFDSEQHHPTALMRFVAFGTVMLTLKGFLYCDVDMLYSTVVLLVWRWADLVLMLKGIEAVEQDT